jgi:rhamnosyltransferase
MLNEVKRHIIAYRYKEVETLEVIMANLFNKPKINVVVCTYNGENFILEQIKSILNQKLVDIKIIILDDCSDDSTLDLVFSNFKFYIDTNIISVFKNNVNIGIYKNFIKGISFAIRNDCDYISLSDQDDFWMEDKLIKGVIKLEENKADSYSSSVLVKYKCGKEFKIDKIITQKKYDYFYEAGGPGSTIILSKKLAFKIIQNDSTHQINLKINHDWYIYAFARHNNFKWIIDDNAYIIYKQHDKNAVGANYGVKAKIRRAIQLINKNFFRDADEIRIGIGANKLKKIDIIKNITQLRRIKTHSFLIAFFVLIYK